MSREHEPSCLVTQLTRRGLLRTIGAAVALCAGVSPALRAEGTPHLDPKDPAALALGYVDNVSQIDAQKTPQYVKGSTCDNCLQLQGTAGENYRPCNLFPGKLVSVSGWCSEWTAEI